MTFPLFTLFYLTISKSQERAIAYDILQATQTNEERMDGIARWNIEHTDILEVLRGQIQEERLIYRGPRH